MEQWIQFAQDKWYLLIGALVAAWIVMNVVKTLVKWVIVIAIVGGLLFYCVQYQEELQQWGSGLANMASEEAFAELKAKMNDFTTNEAVELALGEATDATFEMHEDQTFTLGTNHFELIGSMKNGELDSNIEIRLKDQNSGISINLDDYLALKQFILDVQGNSS